MKIYLKSYLNISDFLFNWPIIFQWNFCFSPQKCIFRWIYFWLNVNQGKVKFDRNFIFIADSFCQRSSENRKWCPVYRAYQTGCSTVHEQGASKINSDSSDLGTRCKYLYLRLKIILFDQHSNLIFLTYFWMILKKPNSSPVKRWQAEMNYLLFFKCYIHTHTHTILLRKEQFTFREGLWFFFSPGPEIFFAWIFQHENRYFFFKFFQTSWLKSAASTY